jgi:hypothetical protein
MKTVLLSMASVAACLALSACGEASATTQKLVKVEYIVADAPVMKANDLCFLRVRPAAKPNSPPQIFSYATGHGAVGDAAFQACTISKVGDLVVRTELREMPKV